MPRTGSALSIRADFEDATHVGSLALAHAVDAWRARGLDITDLHAADAIRTNVLESLTLDDPILVFGVGHGNEDQYTGQDYDNIFWTCDCKELVGRIMVALSCITAARLGLDAHDKGCVCYIGWDTPFSWVMDRVEDPLLNLKASGFFLAVLEILNRLTDGASTHDAYLASMDVWNYWLDYWTRSTDPDAPLIIQHMLNDRDHMKLIGNGTATVTMGIPALWWPIPVLMGLTPLAVTMGIVLSQEVPKAGIII